MRPNFKAVAVSTGIGLAISIATGALGPAGIPIGAGAGAAIEGGRTLLQRRSFDGSWTSTANDASTAVEPPSVRSSEDALGRTLSEPRRGAATRFHPAENGALRPF